MSLFFEVEYDRFDVSINAKKTEIIENIVQHFTKWIFLDIDVDVFIYLFDECNW